MTKMVQAHFQRRKMTELTYFPTHEERKESEEFIRDKEELKVEGHYECFIGNGRCEGHIELHHAVIEFSEANAIDWEKVKKDHPNIDHVDDRDQMIPLCHKHHMGKYTGVHFTTEQAWLAQKYMTPEALDAFEAEVARLKKIDADAEVKRKSKKKDVKS